MDMLPFKCVRLAAHFFLTDSYSLMEFSFLDNFPASVLKPFGHAFIFSQSALTEFPQAYVELIAFDDPAVFGNVRKNGVPVVRGLGHAHEPGPPETGAGNVIQRITVSGTIPVDHTAESGGAVHHKVVGTKISVP